MKALGSEHMAFDQVEERHDGEGPVADLVGQRRQRQVDPLALEARTLAVERDMHAELCVQRRLACSAGVSPAGEKVSSP
ncbi:hypothetical protein ACVIHI_009160 [Bradyrhizobium sp. USDA 4524]|nr:hypothetical protein [Bradyrhizobium sp. USDA 4538]MCP1907303.1 hypothetical protein [Bradyrhizobium sp. USDA 4537]MCP1985779.1 hypothetical protein [Bradyrhizobium sp. USDA 4539]